MVQPRAGGVVVPVFNHPQILLTVMKPMSWRNTILALKTLKAKAFLVLLH